MTVSLWSEVGLSFQAFMQQDYKMSVEFHHQHQQIDDCASEVAVYVIDHGNWEKPILPGGDSCPALEFSPERFDHIGNFWTCGEQKNGKGGDRRPLPYMEVCGDAD